MVRKAEDLSCRRNDSLRAPAVAESTARQPDIGLVLKAQQYFESISKHESDPIGI